MIPRTARIISRVGSKLPLPFVLTCAIPNDDACHISKDVAVYPFSLLTAFFGPATHVSARSSSDPNVDCWTTQLAFRGGEVANVTSSLSISAPGVRLILKAFHISYLYVSYFLICFFKTACCFLLFFCLLLTTILKSHHPILDRRTRRIQCRSAETMAPSRWMQCGTATPR